MPPSQSQSPPTRSSVSPEALFDLLCSEFERGRAFECASECRIPRPVYNAPTTDETPNWFIEIPRGCPRYCHRVMAAVAERLGARYNLLVS